jgi:hypothetical protein
MGWPNGIASVIAETAFCAWIASSARRSLYSLNRSLRSSARSIRLLSSSSISPQSSMSKSSRLGVHIGETNNSCFDAHVNPALLLARRFPNQDGWKDRDGACCLRGNMLQCESALGHCWRWMRCCCCFDIPLFLPLSARWGVFFFHLGAKRRKKRTNGRQRRTRGVRVGRPEWWHGL